MGALGRAPHDQAPADPGRGRRPHLQRAGGQALVHDPLADHDLAAVGPLALRGGPPEGADPVGAHLGEQHGVAAERRVGVGHRRERVVVDRHQLGRVLPLGRGLGHDHGHRLADEAHPVAGQVVAGHLGLDHPRHRPEVDVGPGDHGHHAGHGPGVGDVDALDQRVGGRGPDEGGVDGAGQALVVEVGHVAAALGQQPRVLGPQDPVAEDAHGEPISRA